jgi:membrane dipeptidase
MTVNNKPVIASHSAVWNICKHPRNLKDDQIKAIASSGGVICVNFASDLISEKFRQHVALLKQDEFGELDEIAQIYSDDHEAMESALEQLETRTGQLSNDPSFMPSHQLIVDHIEYIIRMVGSDHVGMGSSFDGSVYLPSGLEDCTKLPLITEELIQRGHSNDVIAGILGGNILRALEEVIGS